MKKILLISMLMISLVASLNLPQLAEALSGSDFKPGRIIDDGLFFNGNTLSAADVQGFLNSKVLYCDTNGSVAHGSTTRAAYGTSVGYAPPYTCLKDFRQDTPVKNAEAGLCNGFSGGNKTAAQIIYEVGQQCGISQKVLLVLLEKEQSLVTDDWPWSYQYRSATGYGCPDTAPCDTEYYGFFNQVYSAARQFKRYSKDQTVFRYRAGRDNFIQYNPSSSCGGTNVYIENQATAGLYNYTPYQPNGAALGNLNGAGDSCSAYGNRNFWKLYNDWFGSTRYSYGKQPSYTSTYARSNCVVPVYDSTSVGRLYNPDTQDYLYTTNRIEACIAISYGYIWDDVVMQNVSPSDAYATPVYRLVNYNGHFYTTDTATRDNYINNLNYKDEGIAFYAYNASTASNTMVKVLTNGQGGYFLTSAGKEADYFMANYGYTLTGASFYTPLLGNRITPVLRISRNNQRLYTTNPIEKQAAIQSYGYQDEGSVSNNDIGATTANTPVYRLKSPQGLYFYTYSRAERDSAVVNYDYLSEGISFYTLLYSNTPIFRASNYQNNLKIFTNSRVEYDQAQLRYSYSGEGIGWYGY